jgi:aminoglycoside 3-N-acetyltransferase
LKPIVNTMLNKFVPVLKKNALLVSFYQYLKKSRKEFRFYINKYLKNSITASSLHEDLMGCGIKPGDKIVVNSSLSAIGYVDGGAETILDVLMNYITPEGLLVMPSYPHRGMYKYLENYSVFDVKNTPSQNGIITEVFRTRKYVYRSIHPTHPLCFWGKEAAYFAEGHEKSISPYDLWSPYKKLLDVNVKNFCIGVDFEHMIMIRVIDDLYEDYPVPMYFEDKSYKIPVIGRKGEEIMVETKCHDPKKSAVRHNMNLFEYMKNDLLVSRFGNAKTITLSSKKMFEHQIELSQKRIFPYYDLSPFNIKSTL